MSFQRRKSFLFGFLLLLTGCNGKPEEKAPEVSAKPTTASGFPRTLTDIRGGTLTLTAPPKRIVSLAPSNTEILFKLGLKDRVVAVTDSCDFPPEVKSLPNVGGYPYSLEKIQIFKPDLALTSGTEKLTADLRKIGVPVLEVNPKSLVETYEAIRFLGKATGTDAKAEKVVKEMQTAFQDVESKVADVKSRPKVLMVYGTQPIYTTGPESFISDVLKAAGGENALAKAVPGDVISPEQGVIAAPDVIICSPVLKAAVRSIPGWTTGVPAVKNDRFYDVPNDSPLARPGPRLPLAARSLAQFLHPERFPK